MKEFQGQISPTEVGILVAQQHLFPDFRGSSFFLHPALVDNSVLSLMIIGLSFILFASRPLNPVREKVGELLFRSGNVKFSIFLFAAGVATCASTSLLLFDGLPRLTDGIAAVFQAKIFLRGAVSLPLPPDDGFFFLPGILGSEAGVGRWSSMYPPGWPALLLPGVLLGVPWLVNPLLAGGLAVAVSLLGEEIYGSRTGRIAGLLTVLSPFITLISATYLSHTATALFCCLSLLFLVKMMREARLIWGVLSGLCWGAAFLCRPLTALVLGMVFSFGILRRPRIVLSHRRPIAAALLLCAMAASLLAAYQYAITGDPFTPGHRLGLGRFGRLGFGVIDEKNSHTLLDGMRHALLRIQTLSTRLLGWPIAALIFLVAPFALGRTRWEDWWLLAAPLSLLLTFLPFYYYEFFFPGRYLFSSAPMLLLLCTRGWTCISSRLKGIGTSGEVFTVAAAASCIVFAMSIGNADYFGRYGPNHGDVESILPKVVEAYGVENAVVYMDSKGTCRTDRIKDQDFFGTGFLRNSLDLDGEIVYARNSGVKNRLLMERHPDRDHYLYRYLRCEERALFYRLFPGEISFSIEALPPLIPEVDAGQFQD